MECVCLTRGGVGGVVGVRIGFWLYQYWRNMGKVGYVSVFLVVVVLGGGSLGQGLGRQGGVMSVCVVSLYSLC